MLVMQSVPSASRSMASTFSCVRTFTFPFLMTAAQNSISFSFEISSLLNFPCIGKSTGLVITTFCRGYLATVPPSSSCSRVT